MKGQPARAHRCPKDQMFRGPESHWRPSARHGEVGAFRARCVRNSRMSRRAAQGCDKRSAIQDTKTIRLFPKIYTDRLYPAYTSTHAHTNTRTYTHEPTHTRNHRKLHSNKRTNTHAHTHTPTHVSWCVVVFVPGCGRLTRLCLCVHACRCPHTSKSERISSSRRRVHGLRTAGAIRTGSGNNSKNSPFFELRRFRAGPKIAPPSAK